MHERTRDSDEDEFQDRDYDVAALANSLSEAFRYSMYEDVEEVRFENHREVYVLRHIMGHTTIHQGGLMDRKDTPRICHG